MKEKVCVHTSRDIRAVAGQLVKLWIEVFRREKAQGTAKTVKKSTESSPNVVGGSNKPRVKDVQKCNLTTGKQAVYRMANQMPWILFCFLFDCKWVLLMLVCGGS